MRVRISVLFLAIFIVAGAAKAVSPINSTSLPLGVKNTRFPLSLTQDFTILFNSGSVLPVYGQEYEEAVTDFKIEAMGFNSGSDKQSTLYIVQTEGAPKITDRVKIWFDQTPVTLVQLKYSSLAGGKKLTQGRYNPRWKDSGTLFFDRSVEVNFRGSRDLENPPTDGFLPILTAPNNRLRQKISIKTWKLNPDNTVRVTLDGVEIFEKDGKLNHEETFIADYTQLTQGDHVLTFSFYDADVDQTIVKERKWTTFHDGFPKFGLDEYNYFNKNGEKFFPIGSWYTSEEELDKGFRIPYGVAGAPSPSAPNYTDTPSLPTINCVVGTEWGSANKYTPKYYRDFVDRVLLPRGLFAATHGSKAFYSAMEASQGEDFKEALTAWINALKDHPNNMAWYVEDEPEFKKGTAKKKHWTLGGVRKATEWVREVDSNFPVWINHVGKYFVKGTKDRAELPYAYDCYFFGLNGYIPQHDVFGIDFYPYSGVYKKSFRTMGAVGLTSYIDQLENVKKWNLDMTALTTFIEVCCVFPEKERGVGIALQKPITPASTSEQVWNQVWVSVIHDCHSICWFQYFKTQQMPYVYESMVRTKEWIDALTDTICSKPNPVTATVEITSSQEQARVDLCTRLSPEKDLLIMAADVRNTLDIEGQPEDLREWSYVFGDAVMAKISVEGLADGTPLYVIGEERSVIIQEGSFEDSFDTLEVHLYTTDKTMSGITSEVPAKTGPVDPKGLVY